MEDSNNPYKKVAITTGHLLPLILASIIIISLLRCDDGPFGAALILGLFWWLILPVTIWALVVFVRSVKMRTKLEKIVFAWGCVLLVLTGIFIFSPFNKEKPCNPDIMAEYCNEHEQEMRELIAYANQSLEPGKRMELEFEKGKVSRFHIFANDKDSIWSTHWNPVNTDSIMQIVGLEELTKTDLMRILSVPKNALCRQYRALFRQDGVELRFTKSALEEIADRAIK